MTPAQALPLLLDHTSLSRSQAQAVFTSLMKGDATPVQIAALLTALRMKGETIDELAGAAMALREAAVAINTPPGILVDTCGTGGDRQGTINISTAAAFVVAGAGFTVAKHGNRSVSSHCGSADVLEAAGIPPQPDLLLVERALAEIGIAFLFAPAFHPAMRHTMPVRKELGVRTIFNLLGPLANPARPAVQIVGVFAPEWVMPVARVLVALGCQEGMVLHSRGHDELVLSAPSTVAQIIHGRITRKTLSPRDFGLRLKPSSRLSGGDAATNAQMLLAVLEGEQGDARDVICMNAAAAIQAAARHTRGERRSLTLREAYVRAQESLDRGRARERFLALKALYSGRLP